MLAYSALLRSEAADAERLAAEGLAPGPAVASPPLWFALQAVHGAAVFDLGDRAGGLAELHRARSDFGVEEAGAELCAALALLEFRAALLLGHSAAARTALAWLAERTGDSGELLMMRAWLESAGGRRDHARSLIRPVLDGSTAVLLPSTMVDTWLLETAIAASASERPAARRALRTALALAEPLDAIRPFALAEPGVRELLVHQHGSFGAWDEVVDRALAAGAGRAPQRAMLSEREITVLGLLPSLLSLDDIAVDLTVSVNTVKSHVRSIYAKLGVSSRRLAVLAAHEHGLLSSGAR
jgi:LuxR family maltose regulon positive regulatory protein